MYTIASRRFNVQAAADARRIAELLVAAGWQRVPGADWRWIVQALNPEPDAASLPLLGRAFEGHSEVLSMQRQDPASGVRITFRLWDSGWRLQPGDSPLLLGQVAEERLVQRLGLFSYWQAVPLDAAGLQGAREALAALRQQSVADGLLLIH